MNLTLFDLDGTLLEGDSDHAFGEWVMAQGWADRQVYQARNDAFYADYLAGQLDIHATLNLRPGLGATVRWRFWRWRSKNSWTR